MWVKSVFILSFLCCLGLVNSYLEFDSWLSIELHHAIDPQAPEEFTPRGNITVPSLSMGTGNIQQEPLTTAQRNKLKKLAEGNHFYRLRATVTYSDGPREVFLTSSKACALANSVLNDILWVSIDSVGSVLGVTQTVSGNGHCKSSSVSADDLEHFNTDVLVKHIELAPVPDTTTFIQKLEREREARERGEVRDNRGFFAKYWMYIVPVALLVLISGATNPEASSGGGR